MSRFQFVADHLHAFEVKWLCAVVEVARSSFYAWLAGADGRAARRAADEALAERIRAVHDEDNTYGAPRITAELNDGAPEGQRVNHKRVARVMRGAGIAGYRRRRRVKTTVADPANQKVPDLLKRDFTAAQVNTRLRRRHHLLAIGDRRQPVPGHRDRLLFTAGRRVGDRRSHAHRTGHRCAQSRCCTAGFTGWCNIPCRSWKSVHLTGFRESLPRSGGRPVDGCGGVKCR
ncbi:transposase [Mycolicibacterium gilvum]|uniref:Transposase n=1 Tax=Mycolicibacterium gilvum TaxID=1804 RepID=A0A378SMU2_9MYCO|nr:transposase [Mycolicibacterium gilvum]